MKQNKLIETPKDYELIAQEIGQLLNSKQKAYGNAFDHSGEILKILYPQGISPEHYSKMLYITRVLDKMFRIAKNPNEDEDPFQDIAGYSILALAREKE